jgi:hypothetical protein
MKLDKTLWNYITEIKLVLPILDGIFLLYFYIYTFISNNYIILICLIDSLINYDLKRNAETEKWEGNVVNGTLGLKRDANLQLIVFFHSYEDIREVFIGHKLIFIILLFMCRFSAMIRAVLNGANILMLEYSYNSLVLYIILSLSLTNFYFN